MKKRRVEVMIETHQTWIIRKPYFSAPAWCQECARTVRLVTADEAARLVCQSTRTIYRLVEERRLHYRETPGGSLLVCLDSLFAGAAAHTAPEILAALERGNATRRDHNQET
ncbi:MAG TPA: hypothetical protein VF658_13310 [Pyrinomonadaceae bacterium]|jgi:hypothetical protein